MTTLIGGVSAGIIGSFRSVGSMPEDCAPESWRRRTSATSGRCQEALRHTKSAGPASSVQAWTQLGPYIYNLLRFHSAPWPSPAIPWSRALQSSRTVSALSSSGTLRKSSDGHRALKTPAAHRSASILIARSAFQIGGSHDFLHCVLVNFWNRRQSGPRDGLDLKRQLLPAAVACHFRS